MTTRNLFDKPDLLESQTRLILSADTKPNRLARNPTRSAAHQLRLRERLDSEGSTSPIREVNDNLFNEYDENRLRDNGSPPPEEETINYDTDIGEEPEPSRDYTSKGVYLEQCRRYGIIPLTKFLRHVDKNDLTIRYCGLKPIHIRVMVPSLIINSTITKLDLRENDLGSRGAIYLANLIQENEYIDEINFGNNGIGTLGCKALCEALKLNRTVRTIHLDGNRFNDDCAPLLAEVFSLNDCITYINLNRNHFENETTGRLFGQSLSDNQTLEELRLGWNRLNSKACGLLVKQLGTNVRLATLDLSWNGAGLYTAKALSDFLKKNTVIEKLYLDNNRFNTECAVYIGRGLSKNESLKILTLNGNPLESSGCYALLRPLIKHPTSHLETIDLRGMVVNNDFLDLVKELYGILSQLTIKLG